MIKAKMRSSSTRILANMHLFFFNNTLWQGHPCAPCCVQWGRKHCLLTAIHLSDLVTVMLQCAALSRDDLGDSTAVWAVCLCNPLCSCSPTDISFVSLCLSAIFLFALALSVFTFLLLSPPRGPLGFFFLGFSHFSHISAHAVTSFFLSPSPIPLPLFPDLPRWALAGSRRWQLY